MSTVEPIVIRDLTTRAVALDLAVVKGLLTPDQFLALTAEAGRFLQTSGDNFDQAWDDLKARELARRHG